jgi:hypothetical protein
MLLPRLDQGSAQANRLPSVSVVIFGWVSEIWPPQSCAEICSLEMSPNESWYAGPTAVQGDFSMFGIGEAIKGETNMFSEYSGDERLLTKGEVARLCRVDIRTVDRWVTAGKVGCHRTPSGRVLFRKRDVLTIIFPGQAESRAR